MLAEVRIAAELLKDALTPRENFKTLRCIKGLPGDAELRSAEVIWEHGGCWLLLKFETAHEVNYDCQFQERFEAIEVPVSQP